MALRTGRLRGERGTSLVETALVAPLLLLLTFAVAEFASVFYVYLALENGISQAARFGVTGNVNPGFSHEGSIVAEMRRVTPTLTIEDDAFSFQHFNGTTWTGGVGGPGEISRISVDYEWALMTPLLRDFFPSGALAIHVEATMKNEPRFE